MKTLLVVMTLLSGLAAAAQERREEPPPPIRPADVGGVKRSGEAQTFLDRLKREEIELDREAGQVSFPAVVLRDTPNPAYPVEYLIVTDGGSTHETILLCRITPSLLNACLLALGLTPGRTIRFVKKPDDRAAAGAGGDTDKGERTEDGQDAAPSDAEEGALYEVIPPQGTVVFLSVAWKDEEGRPVVHPLEDLLVDVRTGEMLPVRGFVYVGSRFRRTLYRGKLRDVYMADLEGNIAANYLAGLGNCLFDIDSSIGQWDDAVAVNGALMPARETVVRIVVSLRPLKGTRPPDAEVLARTGIDLRPVILKEHSRQPVLRDATAEELALFDGLSFADLAARLARGDSERQRSLAAALLGACRSPAAAPLLLGALREAEGEDLREALGRALVELATFDAATGLIRFLDDEREAVRSVAHRALELLSGEELPPDGDRWKSWLQDNIDRFR